MELETLVVIRRRSGDDVQASQEDGSAGAADQPVEGGQLRQLDNTRVGPDHRTTGEKKSLRRVSPC